MFILNVVCMDHNEQRHWLVEHSHSLLSHKLVERSQLKQLMTALAKRQQQQCSRFLSRLEEQQQRRQLMIHHHRLFCSHQPRRGVFACSLLMYDPRRGLPRSFDGECR